MVVAWLTAVADVELGVLGSLAVVDSVWEQDEMSTSTSYTPHVFPIIVVEITSPCSFTNDNVAPDNLQRHPDLYTNGFL